MPGDDLLTFCAKHAQESLDAGDDLYVCDCSRNQCYVCEEEGEEQDT